MSPDDNRYRPRHRQADDESAEIRIAQEIAWSFACRPLDVIAAELRRRLTDAGLRPVGVDFMQLVNAIVDGSINRAQ